MSSQEINYAETLCDKIIDILKKWDTGGRFKEFFYGDLDEIPTDVMPCIIVDKMTADVEQGPTATDVVTEVVQIIIILNKKTYMDDFDESTVSWKKLLELLIEGNDPVLFEYDPTTIFGVLRTNFTLGNFLLNQKMRVKYFNVRQTPNSDESIGGAYITFTATHFQSTPAKI